MITRVVAIAALLVGALMAGCSDDDHVRAPQTRPVKKQGPEVSVADATAAANAINLTSVPGFTKAPADPNADAADAKVRTCQGGRILAANAIVDLPSPRFAFGTLPQQQTVTSSVAVLPTETLAAAELTAFAGNKGKQCLLKVIADVTGAFSKDLPGLRFTTPVATPIVVPDGAGWRFTMTASLGPQKAPFVLLAEEIRRQHTLASIRATDFGQQPLDIKAEVQKIIVAMATSAR